jgi:hypothetical protein
VSEHDGYPEVLAVGEAASYRVSRYPDGCYAVEIWTVDADGVHGYRCWKPEQ